MKQSAARLGALIGLMLMGCAEAAPPAREALTLLLHPISRARIGEPLQAALAAALPDRDVELASVERSRTMVGALQRGEADLALSFADIAYLAYTGQLPDGPYAELRGVATLNTSRLYVLVRNDSPLRSISDFGGRRVSLGLEGGSTEVAARSVLEGLGVDAVPSYESFDEAAVKLRAGALDAVFAVGSQPLAPLERALQDGGRLISIPEHLVARLQGDYPFLRPFFAPPGTYAAGPVIGVGINRVLLCRAGLPDDVVRTVAEAFFTVLPRLSALDVLLQDMNVESAKATSVPLHPGAARYYRDQQLM